MSSMQMVSKLDMPLPLYDWERAAGFAGPPCCPANPDSFNLSSLHFYSRENVQKPNPTPPVSPAFHTSQCRYIWAGKPSSVFYRDGHLKARGLSACCPPFPPSSLPPFHFHVSSLKIQSQYLRRKQQEQFSSLQQHCFDNMNP